MVLKIILKYGLLVGIIVGIYMMVEYAIGLHGKYLSIAGAILKKKPSGELSHAH